MSLWSTSQTLSPRRSRSLRPLSTGLVGAVAALTVLLGGLVAPAQPATAAGPGTTASTAAKKPATPSALPTAIEDLASYVPAVSCDPTAKKGTVKLGRLLTSTYPGTSFGGARDCGALPDSEHHDGRAVDWMNSVRNAHQKAQAKAVISWLLATDAEGNRYANARRLGVMYIIWNNKIWGAYSADQGWRAYSSCATEKSRGWDTSCHRDHMHISLSWAGAMGRTSYWSSKVAAPDYGPCRSAGMNWAYAYSKANPNGCLRQDRVRAPKGSSATMKTLTDYSGRPLRAGMTNDGVAAVQKTIKSPVTGHFGATTRTDLKQWQTRHDLSPTGRVNVATWRKLLKAAAPK